MHMTQSYKIRRLRWEGKITFEDDWYPVDQIESEVAPFRINSNQTEFDDGTQAYFIPDGQMPYQLSWHMCEYYDEWERDFRTIKEAKQYANEYWTEFLERGLIKC